MTDNLYIILFEHKDALRRITFKTTGLTYTDWAEADAAAKEVAGLVKGRTWVLEFPKPNLLEPVERPKPAFELVGLDKDGKRVS